MCYCTSPTCGLLESLEQQGVTTTRNTKFTPDMGTTNNNNNNPNNNNNSFTTTKDTMKIRHSTTKITGMIRVIITIKVTVTRVVTVTKVTRVVTVTKVTRMVTVTKVTRVVTIKVITQKVAKTRVVTKNRATNSSSNSSLLPHQEEEEEVEPGVLSWDLLLLPEVDHEVVMVVLVVEHLSEELLLGEVTLEDEVDNKDREEVLVVEEEPGVLLEEEISRAVLERLEDVGGLAVLGEEVVRPGEPVEVEVGIS